MKLKKIFLIIITIILIDHRIFSQQNKLLLNKISNNISVNINKNFIRFNKNSSLTKDEFLKLINQYLNLGPNDKFEFLFSEKDELGYTHYHYIQKHNGIEIEGAEYILHEKDGYITATNGKFVSSFNKNFTPHISQTEALQIAINKIIPQRKLLLNQNNSNLEKEVKLIYTLKNNSMDFSAKNLTLAYKVTLPEASYYAYVDAVSGKVIKKISSIIYDCDCCPGDAKTLYNGWQTITTHHRWLANDYVLKDNCRGDGIKCLLDEELLDDGDNQWSLEPERPATSAFWALEKTYDFYMNVFHRNSFDNNGAYINANVTGEGYDNAYWNNLTNTFIFGKGQGSLTSNALVSLDVVGHEFTHAVTQYEANLMYEGESGALNESFSDIFGTMVEFYVEGSNGDYLIGEDFWTPDGKMRDMKNPKSKLHPDTYKGMYWFNTSETSNDHGGVHINNGVQNHWFYLLSEGGNGVNDYNYHYNVEGIGKYKASAIAYRNLTVYLTSYSNYFDARNGSIFAAIDLFGECSNEVKQTINAWNAVGVTGDGGLGYNVQVNCADLFIRHNILHEPVVTYRAINNLTSNCSITPNGLQVKFIAGNSIILTDGFNSGDNFIAEIIPCENNFNKSDKIVSSYSIPEKNTEFDNRNSVNIKKQIYIYPNPSSSGFYSVSFNNNFQNTLIQVYNFLGELILKMNPKTNNFKLDLSNQPDGIYIVKFISNNNVYQQKIVKQ